VERIFVKGVFLVIIPKRTKFCLLSLLILLNIILRFQAVSQEIGSDSFLVHMMANSISEFGYARWILSVNSFFGMYPYSEVSAVPFLLSGIFQLTEINMSWVIFFFCIILGILSIFTAYIMANAIINDDAFKLLSSFVFSTSPAILTYSTWTIPTRGAFVILSPLLVFVLLKTRTSLKYVALATLLSLFLYSVHHMIYFFIPIFFSFIVIWIVFERNIGKIYQKSVYKETRLKISPLIPILGFIFMFSIPFFTGKFIEVSRYYPIYEAYLRYIGLLVLPAMGGLAYLIFKQDKSFEELFLLLSIIFLTVLIYEQTYMKWFLPIFAFPLVSVGLLNIIKLKNKRYAKTVSIFLIMAIIFSGFYQFLNDYGQNDYTERYMEKSTYITGKWMKEYINGSAISNDINLGKRIASASETVHILIAYTMLDYTYGFVTSNMSDFTWYPITSENFWFGVGEMTIDPGEYSWDRLNSLNLNPKDFDISYYIENTLTKGDLIWHHGRCSSNLLNKAYKENNLVCDSGKVRIWELK
jgi:hypothetical protein